MKQKLTPVTIRKLKLFIGATIFPTEDEQNERRPRGQQPQALVLPPRHHAASLGALVFLTTGLAQNDLSSL